MKLFRKITDWLGLTVEPDVQMRQLEAQLVQAQADVARLRGDAETLVAVRATVADEFRAEICGLERDLSAERENVRAHARTIAQLKSALAVAQLSRDGHVDREDVR